MCLLCCNAFAFLWTDSLEFGWMFGFEIMDVIAATLKAVDYEEIHDEYVLSFSVNYLIYSFLKKKSKIVLERAIF